MNLDVLNELGKRLYLTVEDVAQITGVKPESARVTCARYARRGVFIRIKNDFYVLAHKWNSYARNDYFRLAGHLQVPSYISFLSALAYYGLTTQVPGLFFESAALKRSRRFSVRDAAFSYYKLRKKYFFDFTREGGFFIARREKAFVDSVFLASFGKYSLDINAIDVSKLDRGRLRKIIRIYPARTQQMMGALCGI